jgi:hypothetical protein
MIFPSVIILMSLVLLPYIPIAFVSYLEIVTTKNKLLFLTCDKDDGGVNFIGSTRNKRLMTTSQRDSRTCCLKIRIETCY